MKYITLQEEDGRIGKIVSSHPQVEKIWFFGGNFAGDSKSVCIISIQLKNGERKDFDVSDKGIRNHEEAEKYLQELPL